MSNKKRFAERIRKIQQISNLSLKDFAKALGVPEKTAQNWLYGISYPKPEILEKLVLQFKANPNYILLGEGPPILDKKKRPTSPISKGKRGSAMISPTLSSA